MDRILVATDLSVRSERAVDRAIRIAARLGAKLTAIHVVDDAMPNDLADMVGKEARERLERFVTSRPGADKVDAEITVVAGDPVAAVLEAAEHVKADLLVLGVHRSRAFFDHVRETTMERLVRLSFRPTLLAVDPVDHDYADVLAAVDMSPASTRSVQYAHRLAPEARLALVHAFHVPFKGLTGDTMTDQRRLPFVKETERAVAKWMGSADLPENCPVPTVFEGSPTAALRKAMAAKRPDLLALGVHSRTGLGRMVLGSFTADLIRDPPCDLLVAR